MDLSTQGLLYQSFTPKLASSLQARRQQSSLALHSVTVPFKLTYRSTLRELLLKRLHDHYSATYEMNTGIDIMLNERKYYLRYTSQNLVTVGNVKNLSSQLQR